LAAMRTRLPKLRDVLAPIRAGLVKMRGWGIALRKAMFTALAAMRAGLLRMFARLASMLAGLAKSIAKMLGKTVHRERQPAPTLSIRLRPSQKDQQGCI
ncbi:MAG: hypothetical protein FWG14_11085, partial [Peptococcaceae bacterium]|nr:hypothetical protein [Peptococcaceae bacterium]